MQTPLEDGKPHLFVSYARRDREAVDWIASRLEDSGYTVWIDRTGILGGTPWQRVIPREIRNAEAVLLMLTPDAAQSEWVRREFFYARRHRIRVVPVLVRPTELPPELEKPLRKIQTVTLWKRRQKGFADLLAALGGLRGVAAQAPGALDQTALRENTRVVSELLRFLQTVAFRGGNAIFNGGNDWAYYIQFSCSRDDVEIYAEAVGNQNLEAPYLLGDKQIARLLELNWEKPDKRSAGNYPRVWEARSDHDRTVIAGVVMRTFLDVYEHLWGEDLEVAIQLN
jgi:TIR domain/T3SS (YopN, CesT) and YbjN peptide-binding chaperone 3